MKAFLGDPRTERALVVLIALHSLAVGFFLLFATRWGATFGGWERVEPLFFARQAGIFHFVVAAGYLHEHFRYRGVSLLLLTKATAVVFLLAMWGIDPRPWSVPFSAAGDGLMGFAVYFVHRSGGQR